MELPSLLFYQMLAEAATQFAPEMHTIWKIIQDTIGSEISEPEKPTIWLGDAGLNRLLKRNMKALTKSGPGCVTTLYHGRTSELLQFKIAVWMSYLFAQELYWGEIERGESHCGRCNLTHDPVNHPHVPGEHLWYLSPSRLLDFIDRADLVDNAIVPTDR
jgi:hypothetical protein